MKRIYSLVVYESKRKMKFFFGCYACTSFLLAAFAGCSESDRKKTQEKRANARVKIEKILRFPLISIASAHPEKNV